MNSRKIDRVLKRALGDKVFKGVYPADKLPSAKTFKFPWCIVTNTDNSGKNGRHWVAMYFDANGKGHFFDSLGLKPKMHWVRYLFKNSKFGEFVSSKVRIQNVTSILCGQFCIYYLIHRHKTPLVISDFNLMYPVNEVDAVHMFVSLLK